MSADEYDTTEVLGHLVREVTDLIEGQALGGPGFRMDLEVADILESARRRIDKVVFG